MVQGSAREPPSPSFIVAGLVQQSPGWDGVKDKPAGGQGVIGRAARSSEPRTRAHQKARLGP
jgi:hypothetical protein